MMETKPTNNTKPLTVNALRTNIRYCKKHNPNCPVIERYEKLIEAFEILIKKEKGNENNP